MDLASSDRNSEHKKRLETLNSESKNSIIGNNQAILDTIGALIDNVKVQQPPVISHKRNFGMLEKKDKVKVKKRSLS